jgi:hypothetical protein
MQLLTLEARAKRIFAVYDVTPEVRDRYEQDWLRSVQVLGDKWLFAKYAERLTPDQQRARCEDGTYRVTPCETDDAFWGKSSKGK